MTHIEDLTAELAFELEDIIERLEELAEYAGEELGVKGAQHKIQEALGRLETAASAARQAANMDDEA